MKSDTVLMTSWTLALFLILATAPAFADDRAAAQEHFAKGSTAFDLGKFDEAIKEYMAAYAAKNDAAILYNLGQAHKLAGHYREALHFYRAFLSRMPTASNRGEVEIKIAELQAVEKAGHAQIAPPSGVVGASEDSRDIEHTAATVVAKPEASSVRPRPEGAPAATATGSVERTGPARHTPVYKQWWLWTVVGVVAAGAAVGIGVGVTHANSNAANWPVARF